MRAVIYIFLVLSLATLPFLLLRAPWAVSYWSRLRFIAVVYALVILIAAIVALVLRWDDIYG